jgi:zinc protease
LKNRVFGAAVAAALVLGMPGAAASSVQMSAAAPSPAAEAIPVRRSLLPDPAIRSGTLANGMRYYVLHSALPAHGLSLRLGFDVGSYDEEDKERGYAHFIEHLAFRATRSAPAGGVDRSFAPFGVAFGRDQNAQTNYFNTSYRLDFASADAKATEAGFGWLRDVADGVLFSDPVVSLERGVVMAERETRNSPALLAGEAIGRFQAAGTRLDERQPAGTVETIAAANAASLRAFYERWYRPENALIVAVGAQPADEIEARIRAAFESWQGKGPKPARPPQRKLDFHRGFDAFTLASPALPTMISACRLRPPPSAGESALDRTTREVRSTIWRGIIAARFSKLVNAGGSGLLDASMMASAQREYGGACLILVPSGDQWEKALAAAQAELRRFAKDGPTEREVETQIEAGRAALRGGISAEAARSGSTMADAILSLALEKLPTPTPREGLHAYDIAVEDLDAPAVKTAFEGEWTGMGPLVALLLPKPVDASLVRKEWMANEGKAGLAAYTDQAARAWAYSSFGKLGTVVARQDIANPGFVRLRFRNGVILNFKQSAREKNQIEVRVRFGAGRHELANSDYLGAVLGSALLSAGGLGRMSNEEMTASLSNIGWSVDFDIGNDAFELKSSTTSANVETQMQVFAAFMSDPGFRASLDERIPTAVDIIYRSYRSEPKLVLSDAIGSTVDPGNPELLPPRERMTAVRSADFARILKPVLTGAPIELTMVGDIDEATARRLVAATLGALPARAQGERARPDAHFLRFPDRPFAMIRTTHQGPVDRAAATLVWPLWVAEPARRREEFAVALAAAVFNDELRRRVRTELGKSYAPSVSSITPDFADQGYVAAQIEAYPTDLDSLVAEARKVAARIADGGVSAEMLEAARRPILARAGAARGTNGWWVGALDGSARDPSRLREVPEYEAQIASITLDEVRAAAAKWLAKDPIVAEAMPAPATQADEAASAVAKAGGR